MLTATPCFALSGDEAPKLATAPMQGEDAGAAKFQDQGVSLLLHDLNASGAAADRAAEHGAMVTYDLGAHPLKADAPPAQDVIAAHPTDPGVNPFLAAFGASDRGPANP